MNIGIITFWETVDNYGQVLQGYALQRFLKKVGYSPYIIRYDHDNKYNDKKRKWINLKRIFKIVAVYPLILYFLTRKERKEKAEIKSYYKKRNTERDLDGFRSKYFTYSPILYHSLKELKAQPPSASIYIAGSDQIWGWTLKKYDNRTFFLDFGSDNIKRIAYAPSFAMEKYPDRYKQDLSELLKKFHKIAVRERTGLEICNSVGVKAEWVCDPTMLLTGQDYEEMIVESTKKPFIFIYSINVKEKSEIFWDDIRAVADEKDMQIIVTTSSGYIPPNELYEGVSYDYSTVEGWISNIYNSDFIVTTSFHGISLSILLNKKFAYVPLKGEFSKGNNRISDLLSLLGLTNQTVSTGNGIQEIYHNDINWNIVNSKLNDFRKKSQSFLINSLKYDKI